MDTSNLLGNKFKNAEFTSSSGKCVCDTKQLKGEASKDSLSGTNSTVEYATSLKISGLGKMGGEPNFS